MQKSVFKGRADQFLLHSHTEERMFRKKLRDVKKLCMTFTGFFTTFMEVTTFLFSMQVTASMEQLLQMRTSN